MIELDQLKYNLNSYREPLEKLSGSLGLEEKKERIEQLELDMEAPGFWEDLEESQKVVREVKGLKDQVVGYEGLKGQFEDIETLIEMASEEEDEELAAETQEAFAEFETAYESLRISTLLSGEYDKNNAILSLHAGAAELSPVTGPVCCTGCIPVGPGKKDSRQESLTIWTGKRQELNQ